MFVLYFIASIFVLSGNYFIIKRLLAIGDVNHHFFAILISIVPIGFHMYIVKFGIIPLFGIDVFDNDFFTFSALLFSVVGGVPYAIAKRMMY
ncbi:hypothetical protein [Edaphovirga cremea]|uniref:hypothetical protein n=1 Tax=Edaphovirga cremea TaxID=2267246 RepID=UPI000DEF0284|nr:hypothetical protein [Edaphovirga cremea]